MKLNSIKEAAESKGVSDKINWKSTKYVNVKIPKKALKAMEEYETVIIGVGGVNDYHNPLAFIIHSSDYLAQLVSVKIPRHYKRIQKQPIEEK